MFLSSIILSALSALTVVNAETYSTISEPVLERRDNGVETSRYTSTFTTTKTNVYTSLETSVYTKYYEDVVYDESFFD